MEEIVKVMEEFVKEKTNNNLNQEMWQREEKKELILPPISDNNCQAQQPQAKLLQYLYTASQRWRVINNAA